MKGFEDRIAMSQRARDVLKVLQSLVDGQRSQAEAARLLERTPRHVRRLVKRLEAEGDGALIHGLRGRPSNRRRDEDRRAKILKTYRTCYAAARALRSGRHTAPGPLGLVVSAWSRPPLASRFAEEMTGSETGHFYLGQMRTFLLWCDIFLKVSGYSSNP